MSRWSTYWFSHGGRRSAAILRIALALVVLASIVRWGGTAVAHAHPAWPALAAFLPGPDVLEIVRAGVCFAALLMLIGLGTRAATAATALGAAALGFAQLATTGELPWRDGLPLLALLAFLGARGGDVLSLDAWRHRQTGRPPLSVQHGYEWSLRLCQAALALALASVALELIAAAIATPEGVAIGVQAALGGTALGGDAAAWLLASPPRQDVAASVVLVAHLAPLLAVFLVRHPALRAVCGAGFAGVAVARALLLDPAYLTWLPLTVVFVDWDALLDRLELRAARRPNRFPRALSPPQVPYHHGVAHVFIWLFLAAQVGLSIASHPARP
jgi:hypothetical protein